MSLSVSLTNLSNRMASGGISGRLIGFSAGVCSAIAVAVAKACFALLTRKREEIHRDSRDLVDSIIKLMNEEAGFAENGQLYDSQRGEPRTFREFEKRLNEINPNNKYGAIYFKTRLIATMCFTGPLVEETAFRGLIQEVALTRIPGFISQKIISGEVSPIVSTIANIARILFTSAIFSGFHLINQGKFSRSYVSGQVAHSFIAGIITGALMKSNAGFCGAVGYHMANNTLGAIGIIRSD